MAIDNTALPYSNILNDGGWVRNTDRRKYNAQKQFTATVVDSEFDEDADFPLKLFQDTDGNYRLIGQINANTSLTGGDTDIITFDSSITDVFYPSYINPAIFDTVSLAYDTTLAVQFANNTITLLQVPVSANEIYVCFDNKFYVSEFA